MSKFVLGKNSVIDFNGSNLTVVAVKRNSIVLSNKLELSLQDVEKFLVSQELVVVK